MLIIPGGYCACLGVFAVHFGVQMDRSRTASFGPGLWVFELASAMTVSSYPGMASAMTVSSYPGMAPAMTVSSYPGMAAVAQLWSWGVVIYEPVVLELAWAMLAFAYSGMSPVLRAVGALVLPATKSEPHSAKTATAYSGMPAVGHGGSAEVFDAVVLEPASGMTALAYPGRSAVVQAGCVVAFRSTVLLGGSVRRDPR
jgi:hypothetical protein